MKAISVRQPWAELIIQNKKTAEIRKFNTAYRGLLLIHAASIRGVSEFRKAKVESKNKNEFAQQSIIGFVVLKDIFKLSAELWDELRDKHLLSEEWLPEIHKYAWVLEKPQRIIPIHYIGLPKIFTVSDEIILKIEKFID